MTGETFTVNVTETGTVGEIDVMIYCSREAGICGPWTGTETIAATDLALWLGKHGFASLGLGEVCANGFSTGDLIDLTTERTKFFVDLWNARVTA